MEAKKLIKNYFENEADGLQLKYKQSSATSHPTDTGTNREEILINFFENHLPHKFNAVRGGKIYDSNCNLSKQVDVIIYENTAPRLDSQGQTLYMAEGVAAAIEVKPKLTKGELEIAIENLKSIKKLEKKIGSGVVIGDVRKDIYCGIFSFETTMSFQNILDVVAKEIGKSPIIDFIVVNNQYLILRNNGEWKRGEAGKIGESVEWDYINFDDGKMILYKFFMLVSREISRVKLIPSYLENYINIGF